MYSAENVLGAAANNKTPACRFTVYIREYV